MAEIKLLTPGLSPHDTADEGLRKYLQFHFNAVQQHVENAIISSDSNHIHKLRTSARRIRSTLYIFQEELDKASTAIQNQRLKEIGLISTPLRDLDVLIPKVQYYFAEQPRLHPPSRILTILEERQKLAREDFIAYLKSENYDQFKNDFAAYLNQPLIRQERKLQTYGKMLLSQHLDNIQKFFQNTDKTRLEEWHKLRIKLKIFHYGVELFSEVLGNGTEELISQTKRLQDNLGELHDTAVAEEILLSVLQEGMENQDPTIKAYLEHLHAHQQTLLNEFPPMWAAFNSII